MSYRRKKEHGRKLKKRGCWKTDRWRGLVVLKNKNFRNVRRR
jgi:hypothetical protein